MAKNLMPPQPLRCSARWLSPYRRWRVPGPGALQFVDETQGVHGYRPTDKRIAELADEWAFTVANLTVSAAPRPAPVPWTLSPTSDNGRTA